MGTQSTAKTKKPWYSIFTTELLFVLLLLFALIIFIYAVRMVFILESLQFDENVFNAVKPYINPGTTKLMLFIKFLGKHNLLIPRSEEHTSELQSQSNLVCRLLLEKKNQIKKKKRV